MATKLEKIMQKKDTLRKGTFKEEEDKIQEMDVYQNTASKYGDTTAAGSTAKMNKYSMHQRTGSKANDFLN